MDEVGLNEPRDLYRFQTQPALLNIGPQQHEDSSTQEHMIGIKIWKTAIEAECH